MNFPVEYLDQLTEMTNFESLLDSVEKKVKPFVLTSGVEPNHYEWERAWVDAGNILPIPVGVPLLWYDGDKIKGLYGTANDLITFLSPPTSSTSPTATSYTTGWGGGGPASFYDPFNYNNGEQMDWDRRENGVGLLFKFGYGDFDGPRGETNYIDSDHNETFIHNEDGTKLLVADSGTAKIAKSTVDDTITYETFPLSYNNTTRQIRSIDYKFDHVVYTLADFVSPTTPYPEVFLVSDTTQKDLLAGESPTGYSSFVIHPTNNNVYISYSTDSGVTWKIASHPLNTNGSLTILLTGLTFQPVFKMCGEKAIYLHRNIVSSYPPETLLYNIEANKISTLESVNKILSELLNDKFVLWYYAETEQRSSNVNNHLFRSWLNNFLKKDNSIGVWDRSKTRFLIHEIQEEEYDTAWVTSPEIIMADVASGHLSTGYVYCLHEYTDPIETIEYIGRLSPISDTENQIYLDVQKYFWSAESLSAYTEANGTGWYLLENNTTYGPLLVTNQLTSTITIPHVKNDKGYILELYGYWGASGPGSGGLNLSVSVNGVALTTTDRVTTGPDGKHFVRATIPSKAVNAGRDNLTITMTTASLESGEGTHLSYISIKETLFSNYDNLILIGRSTDDYTSGVAEGNTILKFNPQFPETTETGEGLRWGGESATTATIEAISSGSNYLDESNPSSTADLISNGFMAVLFDVNNIDEKIYMSFSYKVDDVTATNPELHRKPSIITKTYDLPQIVAGLRTSIFQGVTTSDAIIDVYGIRGMPRYKKQ